MTAVLIWTRILEQILTLTIGRNWSELRWKQTGIWPVRHTPFQEKISDEKLSKVWKIDRDSAQRTLDVTSQHCKRKVNPTLSRNYPTGDRILRYKRLKFFFMDTFFVTQNASGMNKGKRTTSERGHTCCKLFVTDKGFIYVVLMKSKKEVFPSSQE